MSWRNILFEFTGNLQTLNVPIPEDVNFQYTDNDMKVCCTKSMLLKLYNTVNCVNFIHRRKSFAN